jgi:hypothetical protein
MDCELAFTTTFSVTSLGCNVTLISRTELTATTT